jgi:thiamine biosynthesis protein ThiS
MTLHINGERRTFPDGLTVASLVAHLGMKADRVAVELNLEIVPRANWDAIALKDGDKLEIVHFVGGGSDADIAPIMKAEQPTAVEISDPGDWICPTCGSAGSGKFCPNCGEKKSSLDDFSLRHFFAHAFELFFHADSKIFRTFRYVFTKPGFLSAEFARGRRKTFLHPIQVFFVANLAYFLLQPVTHWTGLRTPLSVHTHMMSYSPLASRMVQNRITAKGVGLPQFMQAFDHVVDVQARSLVLVMVPMFALALWGLEWRKRRFFGEHLAFALHYYAFWLIAVFLIVYGLSTPVVSLLGYGGIHFREEALNRFLSWIGKAGAAVYLFVALRTFYKDKALPAAVKAAVLVWATSYIDGLYRFMLFLTALYSA